MLIPTFEKSAGVLLGEGQQNSRGLSELGEGQHQSPDFSLVLEAVGADESQPKGKRAQVRNGS